MAEVHTKDKNENIDRDMAADNKSDIHTKNEISAAEALRLLKEGNQKYLTAGTGSGDISAERRRALLHGQNPYAVVITCSDSRVVPESIFDAGLGDLFVIRVAGNVIDNHQLGSIEYAASHLGCRLVLVLGHTHCGAVDAAINHDPEGYIKFITDEISAAIGDEKDDYRAGCLNVKYSIRQIESSLDIRQMESEQALKVAGAIYHLEDGHVEFL